MNKSRKLLVIWSGSKELCGRENTGHTRKRGLRGFLEQPRLSQTRPNNIHSQAEKLQPRFKNIYRIWPDQAAVQCHMSAFIMGALITSTVKNKTLQPNQLRVK